MTYFDHQASDCLKQKKTQEMVEDKPLKPETGTKPLAKQKKLAAIVNMVCAVTTRSKAI